MEIVKLLLTLFSGGACGAFLNEWFHRRRSRMQPIPLIERVNRLVSSEMKGFVLARAAGDGSDRRLEEIKWVREYQLTLRNTSYIHLHNAEIQFEFPSMDVEARAERPSHSKTTPIPVDAELPKPTETAYRWRIPEFPPNDSMEFTFRAVDAISDEYAVALYGAGQVVIEKYSDEPIARGSVFTRPMVIICLSAIIGILVNLGFWHFIVSPGSSKTDSVKTDAADPTGIKATVIDWAGCSLDVTSSSMPVNLSLPSQAGPWKLSGDILNTGDRKCFLKWESNPGNPFTIEPGQDILEHEEYTNTKPGLVPHVLLFGPDSPTNKATVMLYERGTQ
jgi:hypothetical protein